MAFWLATQRDGQQTDYIQRFDPRFWTVNFPRPAMASVITTGPDSLRVDVEFHQKESLAGLIWESTDRHDHPLLAYDTDRNYARTTLSFRWRSGGVLPLDAVNGPTLTIEGRTAAGVARSWYVRLWNYAVGTPEDATITLPFSALSGGWDVSGNPDPVHPSDIDRIFISLAPPGFDAGLPGALPARVGGWVELEDIACTGDRPMLVIGDVMVPPHDLCMATAYDDSYDQTPARLLRSIRSLGYRDRVLHYVGMSHYYRLSRQANGTLAADAAGLLCGPAQAWHQSFYALCAAQGYLPITSLSYELLAEHCTPAWAQRYSDGTQALTGWDPPSTLLSPANVAAMAFLQSVAAQFVGMVVAAGLPVSFQIGEPWWWTGADGRIALYDAAAKVAFGGNPPVIASMRQSLTTSRKNLLTSAGALLAASTAALRDAIRTAAGEQAEVMLLLFTPTTLDPTMPELRRANMPTEWAAPAYDRLQIEDYDWLTASADALRTAAYATVQSRLAYPLAVQDYLAGFVLLPENAQVMWPLIDAGVDQADTRGITRRFVWALPQVNRDGYIRLPANGETEMQAFDNVQYPLALGRDAGMSAEFSTSISITASGHERRSSHWSDARLHFDVGPGVRSEAELATLVSFFRARRGAAFGFRLRDPFDFSSNGMTGTPQASDQVLGTGNGMTARYRLVKTYAGPQPQVRPITRPRAGTVLVMVGGVATTAFTVEDGGWIALAEAPAAGAEVRAGFLFDVPVRFATDRLDVSAATFAAGEVPSVPLVEVKEAE